MVKWKPFSPKALDAILNCTAFINILEGAVRSSKTLSSIIAWLAFLEKSPNNEFLMSGKTIDTLYRNLIGGATGILAIVGCRRCQYKKSAEGGAQLLIKFGKQTKICYCVGAHNEGSEARIRGMTIGGWLADEVTLYPESFVKQAINRMSLDGAKAIWTTNPDGPYHYIKREFIDKARDKGYRVWHFELDDNYSLSEEYKENVKRAYTGLWYKRMIQGLWVQAEGAVYDMFDEAVHVIDCPAAHSEYYVAIDYGTSTVTTFGLYGLTGDAVYLLKEYYHDAEATGRQKTNSEFGTDFDQFVGSVHPRAIYCDPSASSFKVELRRRGYAVKDADNDVLEGIRLHASFLSDRRFFVDRSCVHSCQEYASYVWDPAAQAQGEDRPLKQNDHCCDRNRYMIQTRFGRPRAVVQTYRRGRG